MTKHNDIISLVYLPRMKNKAEEDPNFVNALLYKNRNLALRLPRDLPNNLKTF